MSVPCLSPIRKVRVFIPPSDSPLLTTYGRSLLPKLSPLKQKYHIFSTRNQMPSLQQNPQPILMSVRDLDLINNVYRKIKKSKGQLIRPKQTQYFRDPLYKSLYNMKKKSLRETSTSFTKQNSFVSYKPRKRNISSRSRRKIQQ